MQWICETRETETEESPLWGLFLTPSAEGGENCGGMNRPALQSVVLVRWDSGTGPDVWELPGPMKHFRQASCIICNVTELLEPREAV